MAAASYVALAADPDERPSIGSSPAPTVPEETGAWSRPHCEMCYYYAAISLGGYQDHFLCTHPQARRPFLLKDELHPPLGCPLLRIERQRRRSVEESPRRKVG